MTTIYINGKEYDKSNCSALTSESPANVPLVCLEGKKSYSNIGYNSVIKLGDSCSDSCDDCNENCSSSSCCVTFKPTIEYLTPDNPANDISFKSNKMVIKIKATNLPSKTATTTNGQQPALVLIADSGFGIMESVVGQVVQENANTGTIEIDADTFSFNPVLIKVALNSSYTITSTNTYLGDTGFLNKTYYYKQGFDSSIQYANYGSNETDGSDIKYNILVTPGGNNTLKDAKTGETLLYRNNSVFELVTKDNVGSCQFIMDHIGWGDALNRFYDIHIKPDVMLEYYIGQKNSNESVINYDQIFNRSNTSVQKSGTKYSLSFINLQNASVNNTHWNQSLALCTYVKTSSGKYYQPTNLDSIGTPTTVNSDVEVSLTVPQSMGSIAEVTAVPYGWIRVIWAFDGKKISSEMFNISWHPLTQEGSSTWKAQNGIYWNKYSMTNNYEYSIAFNYSDPTHTDTSGKWKFGRFQYPNNSVTIGSGAKLVPNPYKFLLESPTTEMHITPLTSITGAFKIIDGADAELTELQKNTPLTIISPSILDTDKS